MPMEKRKGKKAKKRKGTESQTESFDGKYNKKKKKKERGRREEEKEEEEEEEDFGYKE
jgi:hypothetical protein